jgi:thiamine kinase-like enzyme
MGANRIRAKKNQSQKNAVTQKVLFIIIGHGDLNHGNLKAHDASAYLVFFDDWSYTGFEASGETV